MSKILVRKNEKYNYFEWQRESERGFRIFPDWVTDTNKIRQFFVEQTRDIPEIIFCNKQGTPAKLYSIQKDQRYAGQRYAIVDHDSTKKFLFDTSAVVTPEEQIQFLKDNSTRQQDLEAAKIENVHEQIKFYLSNCAEQTKIDFQQMIESKITNEVLKNLCEQNAKTYGDNLKAEVIFQDE